MIGENKSLKILNGYFFILFFVLMIDCFKLCVGQIFYSSEFELFGNNGLSVTSGQQLNCFGLASCGDITSIIHSGGSLAIQCSGGRACAESGSLYCGNFLRANGYLAIAGLCVCVCVCVCHCVQFNCVIHELYFVFFFLMLLLFICFFGDC